MDSVRTSQYNQSTNSLHNINEDTKTFFPNDQEDSQGIKTFRRSLVLEDFKSSGIKLDKVPKTASSTFSGQRMIKPVVESIPYKDDDNALMKLDARTLFEFDLTESELKKTFVSYNHKYNYVLQNKKLASNINLFKHIQQTFKQTVLDKNNSQNLQLLKEQVLENQKKHREIAIQKQ